MANEESAPIFDTQSPKIHGVDPGTGKFHTYITIASLIGNEGRGPNMDLELFYSPGLSDYVFGNWSLRFSNHINYEPGFGSPGSTQSDILRLANGEAWSTSKQINSPTFKWNKSGAITLKNGTTEKLKTFRGLARVQQNSRLDTYESFSVPEKIISPSGLAISIEWETTDPLLLLPRLKSIKDEARTLVNVRYTGTTFTEFLITFDIYPDSAEKYSYEFKVKELNNSPLPSLRWLTEACHPNSSMATSFEYNENINLKTIKRSLNLKEKTIDDVKEEITYDINKKVTRHTSNANGIRVSESNYSYRSTPEEDITTHTNIVNGESCTTDFNYENKDPHIKGVQTKEVRSQSDCKHTIERKNVFKETSKEFTSTTQHIYQQNNATRSETSTSTVDAFANLINTTENGITTEWTYYRGAPKEEDVILRSYTETDASGLLGWLGWIVDNVNPIGIINGFINKQGLTWGTIEEHAITHSPFKTESGKTDYNLPVGIICPGDPNYFRVHPESEKVFTYRDKKRIDLKWTFYGYTALPTKDPTLAGPAVKPAIKLTVIDPVVTADFKKLKSWQSGKMTVEAIEYYTDSKDLIAFDRVKTLTQYLLDEKGAEVPLSKLKTEFGYQQTDNRMTTTSTLTTADGKSVITSRTVSTLTGNLMNTIDAAGNKTAYEYDSSGRLISSAEFAQHASPSKTLFRYETIESLQCITTEFPSGDLYREEHDALGRIVTTKYYSPITKGWLTLSATTYDELSREKQTIEYDFAPDGVKLPSRTMETYYDDWGQPAKVLINDEEAIHTSYDPITHSLTKWRQSGFYLSGLHVNYADAPNGEYQRKEHFFVKDFSDVEDFDSLSYFANFEYLQNYEDDVTHKTVSAYDAWGRLRKEIHSQGPASEYEYDHFGRMTKMVGANVAVRNAYPVHSAAATVISAKIQTPESYTFGERKTDSLGRVDEITVGGRKRTYTYVDSGPFGESNVKDSNLHSVKTASFESNYDKATGRINDKIIGYSDGSSSSNYSAYSLRGVLLESQDSFGNTTQYKHDPLGRLATSTSKLVDTRLSYYDNGSLQEQTITHIESKRTMTISYTYDERLRESERCFKLDGFADLTIKRTYEGAWLVSSEMLEGNELLRSEQFTYTSEGRLASYQCNGSQTPVDPQGKKPIKQAFTYDGLGNITQCVSAFDQDENTSSFTYDTTDRTQLKSVKHTLEPFPKTMAVYDEVGRLKEDFNGRTLSYNETSKLSYLKSGSGKTFADYEYTYDNLGRQVGCSGTDYYEKYYYQGQRQYARSGRMTIDGKSVKRTLVLLNESDACILQQVNMEPKDGKPSVSNSFELMDAAGSLVASYDLSSNRPIYFAYTPFGYRPDDWSKSNWLGFNGQPIDRVTNTYHLGNGYRVYDPANQHFQAPDSLSPFGAGGLNGYNYCSNNPINFSDPSGHAQVVHQYSVMTHQPFLYNPVVRAVMVGGIGIALAPFTGGASAGWTAAAIGLAVTSAAFGVASAALEESNPELSSALGWASLGTGLAGAGAGLVGAKLAARSAMLAASAERAVFSGTGTAVAGGGRVVRMGGPTMQSLRQLDDELFMFVDTHKHLQRLNIGVHGKDLTLMEKAMNSSSKMILNNAEHSASDLLFLLNKKGIDPNVYDYVRLLMCYSGNGGAASFAAQFRQLINTPVKGYIGSVSVNYGASNTLQLFKDASAIGPQGEQALVDMFAKQMKHTVYKTNPYLPNKHPQLFADFTFDSIRFP
jgi:RHS repeat-associated protein